MPMGQRTPGPINIFVRFRNQATAVYLGTCVTAPENEEEKYKIPVLNDLGGRSVPFQLVQDGQVDYVYATVNRFDYFVVQNIKNVESGAPPTGAAPNPAIGIETGLARGTLTIGISDFELILTNQYFGTTSAGQFVGGIAASDLAFGRRYYSANMRKCKESTVGTRVLEIALAFECQNVFLPASRGFQMYTEDPTNFGQLAPLV